MSEQPQSPTVDYLEKRDALVSERNALLEQAGITKEAKSIQRIFEPDYFRDRELAPFGTELRQRQQQERDATDWLAFRSMARDEYFRVQDSDMRRKLIGKERAIRQLDLQACVAEVGKAKKCLRDLESKSESGFAFAITAAFIVLLSAWVGGLIGAIAAAVFSVIFGIYSFRQDQINREREIARAQQDVRDAEESLKHEELQKELFSHREEAYGDPD